MLGMILLQAAAGAGLAKIGACIGAGIAAIGAGLVRSDLLPWSLSLVNQNHLTIFVRT